MRYALFLMTMLVFASAAIAATRPPEARLPFARVAPADDVDHFRELAAHPHQRWAQVVLPPSRVPAIVIQVYLALGLSLLALRLAPVARTRRQAPTAAEAMSRTR